MLNADNRGEERNDDGDGASILSFGRRNDNEIVNQKIKSKTKQVESCEEPESGCNICNQTCVESEHIVECTATSCSRRGCLKCNKDHSYPFLVTVGRHIATALIVK